MSHKSPTRSFRFFSLKPQVCRNVCMFPVMLKPKTWTFSWGMDLNNHSFQRFDGTKHCKNHSQSDYPLVLGQSKVLVRQQLLDYVGSVACLIDESVFNTERTRRNGVQKLFIILGVQSLHNLPLKMLVSQACLLAKQYQDKSVQFEELRRIHNTLFSQFESIVKNEREKIPDCLNDLRDIPVILIGTDLVKAENVAFLVKEEYKPVLYRVPDAVQVKWNKIYRYLGVTEHFSVSFIIKEMTSLKENWQADKSFVEKIHKLLINLKDTIEKSKIQFEDLYEYYDAIVAPDNHCELWPTYELAAENVDFKANIEMKILHRDIPISLGESLGVKTKELKCFQKISKGVSFGQREKLVTRIKGLLKAYPCDESIMKELLQNADDAGATEIHFVKDYRYHSTRRLFSSSCKPLQGPALCVYNNSYFTKDDIEGIHNLGQGSKSDDPTKTGQYGVGFNAVYHLSDTPAFITKGPGIDADNYLIILDPLCKYVPLANIIEPGQMCELADVQTNFPDHLLGFSQDKLITGEAGTVFRFPLRSKMSAIEGEIVNTDKMDSILNSFRQEMNEAVIFLKNITCIKVSRIDPKSGDMIEEYSVNVHLSGEAEEKRKHFNDIVITAAKMNKGNRERNLDVGPHEVMYPIKVTDSNDWSTEWLIIQQFGHKWGTGKLEDLKTRLKDGDLGLLPVGGVAIPIKKCREKEDKRERNVAEPSNTSTFGRLVRWVSLSYKQSLYTTQTSSVQATVEQGGKAFCFLPLPVNTGLPVHVNGHFALDHESRRDLWKDGYRMEWNAFILESVIIPSWIAGILYMQKNVEAETEKAVAWLKVKELLEKYHILFPLHDQATSKLWKNVVSQFYTFVVKRNVDVFPSVRDCKNERSPEIEQSGKAEKRFNLTWTCINAESNQELGGCFNTIYSMLPYTVSDRKESSHLIGDLLKSFGMKLLETPLTIRNELEIAGIKDVNVASPGFVLSYIRGSSCDIGAMNVDISISKFRTVDNLRTFLNYISLDKSFADKISGLPILLTGDSILRRFSKDYPIFITEFSKLLPASSCRFVHDVLRPAFTDENILQSGVCKSLSFEDFVQMLPDTLQRNVYASGSELKLNVEQDKECKLSVSHTWLRLFYDFLCDQSLVKKVKDDSCELQRVRIRSRDLPKTVDLQKFRSYLEQLHEWSLLPCIKSGERNYLIPIDELSHVLYLSSLQKADLMGLALLKLDLPSLDVNVFRGCREKDLVHTSVVKCVASLDLPADFLECLVHHKNKISQSMLTVDEGTEIIAYFGRMLRILLEHREECVAAKMLRELPLFVTLQDTLTSIENIQEVIVIPKGMPVMGIQEWADRCSVVLLQEKDLLEPLYQILGLRKADIENVYCQMILPRFHAMPEQHWIEHITFLKNRLGSQMSNTPVRASIKKQLANIAFINVDGVMKRVNQLFDRENEVFRCMKTKSDFPPEMFQTYDWRYFLTQLGLVCEVTDDMMLQFATEIELEGSIKVDNNVYKKANVLLNRFCEDKGTKWQESTLARIKSVRFIKLATVEKQKSEIWPQCNFDRTLICFQESVSSKYSVLCWTSAVLISDITCMCLHKKVRSSLGIYDAPSLDQVVLHCQNICDVLKPKLKATVIYEEFLKEQMNSFYEYFSKTISSNEVQKVRSRLQYTSFIHLPEERELVTLNEIIIDLPSHSEIKPYLYKAPKYYGRYHDLFEMLGSKKKILFSHYSYVMQKLKDKCKDMEMTPFERKIAQRAIKGLVGHKLNSDNSANDVKSMFLPNQELVLVNSKQIIVSDNMWFEERLHSKVAINYFAGLQFLELSEKDVKLRDVFSKWPAHLKPILLSDCVEETVCLSTENRQMDMSSNKAIVLQDFLHSPELSASLGGILKHQLFGEGISCEDIFISEAVKNLRTIRVVEIPFLRTVLKYRGDIINGSGLTIPYHIRTEDSNGSKSIVFYFSDANESEVIDTSAILVGLFRLIQMCVSDIRYESYAFVMALFQYVATPEKLPELLQRLQIKPHFSSQSTKKDYFPKPGTYVESRFIPYLEQGILPFEDYEFNSIAMELEDNWNDTVDFEAQMPVYIYVKIVKEGSGSNLLGDLGKIYIVRTGNTDVFSEEVPIYRLYRFVRREEDPGSEVQRYDVEPITSRPFDAQCQRIRNDLKEAWKLPEADRKRVIRRLLLKWHPDKNRGNEDYCKKVFQYIKIVISRLQNGELIREDPDEEMSRGPSESSPSTSRYYDNINRRAQAYARAYYENYDNYCRSERTGPYSHYSAQETTRSDSTEAQRWMRQSKNDYRAAEAMLPLANDVDGFNWICYLCHQACEKALKATRYSRDANNVPRGSQSHCLTTLTTEPAMLEQARQLESRLGDHARLRYPDAVHRPQIPSDKFKQDDAEFSIGVAQKIIGLAEDYIS